jgi:hypothetical protein
MRRLLLVLLVCVGGWASTAVAADNDRIPPGYVSFHRGHRISGQQFGVRIGDTEARAFAALAKRGISIRQYDLPGECKAYLSTMADCSGMDRITSHRLKQPLRDGMIFLGFKNDRVAAIYWRAQLIVIDL